MDEYLQTNYQTVPIVEYVIANYDDLPKSSFDNEECVIVKQLENDDFGYGHHCYEGIGVNSEGKILWCYSSGCSRSGSCGMDHTTTEKAFEVDSFDLSQINPEEVNFEKLSVSFSSY